MDDAVYDMLEARAAQEDGFLSEIMFIKHT